MTYAVTDLFLHISGTMLHLYYTIFHSWLLLHVSFMYNVTCVYLSIDTTHTCLRLLYQRLVGCDKLYISLLVWLLLSPHLKNKTLQPPTGMQKLTSTFTNPCLQGICHHHHHDNYCLLLLSYVVDFINLLFILYHLQLVFVCQHRLLQEWHTFACSLAGRK